MQIHPLCAIVPDMSAAEYAELVADMRNSGFDPRFPVVVYDGMILDGRHRYKAAIELGITPPTIEWEPRDGDSLAMFVLRATKRRSLTSAQRAALAVELLPTLKKEAEKRKKSGARNLPEIVPEGSKTDRETSTLAARSVGTNRKYVDVAARAKKSAPVTFEKMRSGTISVAAARREISQPKAAPDPATIRKDRLGNPITDEAVLNAFAEAEVLSELMRRISALKGDIASAAKTKGCSYLETYIKDTAVALDEIRVRIRESQPWATCPRMPNCAHGCKLCGGRRFVSKRIVETVGNMEPA